MKECPSPEATVTFVSEFFNTLKLLRPSYSPFLKCAKPNFLSWTLTLLLLVCWMWPNRMSYHQHTFSLLCISSFAPSSVS